MFCSPSTFAFGLFFLFEASFIPLAARQVLLCLACLLSPARLEHIAASSSHSSTSSFERCSNSFVNFLIFQFFLQFDNFVYSFFHLQIFDEFVQAKFKFFCNFFNVFLSSNLLTNSSKHRSNSLVKN